MSEEAASWGRQIAQSQHGVGYITYDTEEGLEFGIGEAAVKEKANQSSSELIIVIGILALVLLWR